MPVWKASRTLLLVGEGKDEVGFLTHLKNLFSPRGCGLHVKIINARGKGAKHVVDYALRHQANGGYDYYAVLLDTDTDFNDQLIKKSESLGLILLPSEPCLEALLLRILDIEMSIYNDLKKQLQRYVKNSTQKESYAQHFTKETLEAMRSEIPTLDKLIELLNIRW